MGNREQSVHLEATVAALCERRDQNKGSAVADRRYSKPALDDGRWAFDVFEST
jgi:hypothetical protein